MEEWEMVGFAIEGMYEYVVSARKNTVKLR